MAVPKRRTSKTRKNKRRTHLKISVPGMTECPNCGEIIYKNLTLVLTSYPSQYKYKCPKCPWQQMGY